jgi:hypothetical protein
MPWFRKKADPISDRERALNEEIAQLETKIKQLDTRLHKDQDQAQPRWRSTAVPQRAEYSTSPLNEPEPPPPPLEPQHDPIFEQVDRASLKARVEEQTTAGHFNELGVRKYDLPALLKRLRSQFRGPSTTNPKLVSYLAAGGIQGLRPLRYEKRVARNRFIALVIFLFLMLLGIILVFTRHR